MVAALVMVAGVEAAASTQQESRAGLSESGANALVWVAKAPKVNPGSAADPPNAKITARNGFLNWKVLVAPEAEFEATYKPPPARLVPGTTHTIAVKVSGKLTGNMDVQGFRGLTMILYLADRWDGSSVGTDQNCVDPIGAEPTFCTKPKSSEGAFSVRVPTPSTAGDTFSFGVGALNCGEACYVRYEYVASGKAATTPAAKPKTKPALPSSGNLGIDYTMPDRYGSIGADGLVRPHETAAEIRPDEFRVDFTLRRKDGRPCTASDRLRVSAPKALRSAVDGPCRLHAFYPREGRYTIEATLSGADGKQVRGRRQFLVQDWLIFGLGDSNGSGEGAPARKGWVSPQCHRSSNSHQAQAARAIERRDRRTSVTFVHLSCSGASIFPGCSLPTGGSSLNWGRRWLRRSSR